MYLAYVPVHFNNALQSRRPKFSWPKSSRFDLVFKLRLHVTESVQFQACAPEAYCQNVRVGRLAFYYT